MYNQSRKKIRDLVIPSLLVLLGAIAILSCVMLLSKICEAKREQTAFDELSKIVTSYHKKESQNSEVNFPSGRFDSTVQEGELYISPYAELAQRNTDFAAWLQIPGTEIDYPVMFTPDNPEYYLRRAFDRSDSQSGTPFIGADASLDSDCLIIYGHNMKSGSMFGTLERYETLEFWKSQKTFTLDTLSEHREYEVFAVVKTKILAEDTLDFQYYRYAGELNNSRFSELAEFLLEQSLYDTKIQPIYGNQILILSTCSYHTKNGRLIVAAQRSN
ncbi:class B sortase [Intestinimonas sp. HCP28S3_D6]|uniref:class B sortase n=1 Tax=Intestinimonas sp. HCP28S3_D6 TaxID=3438942 RepID=UPI003F8CDC32